jgi:hypothetical protein
LPQKACREKNSFLLKGSVIPVFEKECGCTRQGKSLALRHRISRFSKSIKNWFYCEKLVVA